MALTFGMHRGRTLGYVAKHDPMYLEHIKTGGGDDPMARDLRDPKFREAIDVVRGMVRRQQEREERKDRDIHDDADDPYEQTGDPYL
jgi:hypothetical protein